VKFVRKTPLLALEAMRAMPALKDMVTLRPGNRLSITPVTPAEWKAVLKRLQG
jgi:predicted RNA-binding protein with PUA-like domain